MPFRVAGLSAIAEFTVIATLHALAEKGQLDKSIVAKAIKDLDVNPEKVFPEIRS